MIDFSKEMANYNFADKYAFDTEDGKETWEQSVDRIYEMHKIKYLRDDRIFDTNWLSKELERASKLEKNKVILSSQRARQWGEPDLSKGILAHNEKMYNCAGSLADRTSFFGEVMYLLLCGCGTGYNVCKRHIDKLPHIKKFESDFVLVHSVEDTIEGWANAVHALFDSYTLLRRNISFDFSKIRAKGSLISGRFVHSGYKPLKKALENTENILRGAVGRKLKPIEVFDIVCHLAEAVLSGGVRRSATICLFSWDDEEMMNAKTGNWWSENPQRAMCNISPLMVRSKVKQEDVEMVVKSVKEFGEPGVVFAESEYVVYNPCCEIGMIPLTTDGKSGWQFCNLVEINLNKIKTDNEFLEACRSASMIATMQASYDNFPFLGKNTSQIVKSSALIGVSLTGIMDSGIELSGDVLRAGAKIVNEVNKFTAAKLGIRPAIRTTTVKPSGNASILLGTTSGIHPEHSRDYLRHIRLSKSSDMYKFIKNNVPTIIVNDYGKYDAIIAFPISKGEECKLKEDFTFKSFIDYVAFIFKNWVLAGDAGLENVTNNVSNTVIVHESEWKHVASKLFKMRDSIGGISLLPEIGDKVYPYAPYCSVDVDEEYTQELKDEVRELMKHFDIFDYTEKLSDKEKAMDMRSIYARITFDRIRDEYSNPINWSGYKTQKKENIGSMAAVACSGGACEIR